MIIPSQAVKIVVATKPVDFRKGHDGLAAVVQNELGLDPHSGIIVVFRAKRGARNKVLLWDGLQIFLTDGRVEIDSNPVERTIRPITLNRKNALFAGHDEGGKNWGRIASLIETCKLNGIEPFAYIKSTLEAIAAGLPADQIDDLMCISSDLI